MHLATLLYAHKHKYAAYILVCANRMHVCIDFTGNEHVDCVPVELELLLVTHSINPHSFRLLILVAGPSFAAATSLLCLQLLNCKSFHTLLFRTTYHTAKFFFLMVYRTLGIGKQLEYVRESLNTQDVHAVTMTKNDRNVGHVPQNNYTMLNF